MMAAASEEWALPSRSLAGEMRLPWDKSRKEQAKVTQYAVWICRVVAVQST